MGQGGYDDEGYTWFSSGIPNDYISKRTKHKKYKGTTQGIRRAHDCKTNMEKKRQLVILLQEGT